VRTALASWAAFLIFFVLCFTVRKTVCAQYWFCPVLTLFVAFLASELEPADGVDAQILYVRGMVMTAALFYILVMFNKVWLLNTFFFVVAVVLCVLRTG